MPDSRSTAAIEDTTERLEGLDGDGETIEALLEEAKQTHEYQIQVLADIDSKALSLLRLDVILIGLLLTVSSIVADSESIGLGAFGNWSAYGGVVSLLLSAALAAVAYTVSSTEIGLEPDRLGATITADLSRTEVYQVLVLSLEHWLWYNRRIRRIQTPIVTIAIIFLLIAITHLSLGIYAALVDEYTAFLGVLLWISILVFVPITGVVGQTAEALRLISQSGER